MVLSKMFAASFLEYIATAMPVANFEKCLRRKIRWIS